MRGRTFFLSLAAVLLTVAVASCGSSKKATTAVSTYSFRPPAPRPVTPATYSVNLAGFPGGAVNGSGLAVISVNASRQLCWTFSDLKNVTAPTVARVYRSFTEASGRNGAPLGRTYTSSGCVPEPYRGLQELEKEPQEFYVSIHTAQFPGGAIRGPLSEAVS